MPRLPLNYGVNLASVIYSIQCEVSEAITAREIAEPDEPDPNDFLLNLLATAAFEVEVERVIDASGKPTFLIPFSNFELTGNLGVERKGKRRITTVVTSPLLLVNKQKIEEIKQSEGEINFSCNDKGYLHKAENALDSDTQVVRIRGALGLRDWILSINKGLTAISTDPVNLSYIALFEVTYDGSAGATFMASDAFQDSFGGFVGLGASRKLKHLLTLSTVKKKKPTPSIGKKAAALETELSLRNLELQNTFRSQGMRE